jgi:hypothetical protein
MSGAIGLREPEAEVIGIFVRTLFAYADQDSYVSLRAFLQLREGPPPYIVGSKINGSGLDSIITDAVVGARFAANHREALVFAPPICTFRCPKKADEVNLVNGLAISVELDGGDTTRARERLEGLLGPATVVVASGGEWIDPATGEVFQRLHIHWRLSEPTRDHADHATLKHARRLACGLVSGDPTAKASVHPLRWPGSWHLKATPKLAKVVMWNDEAEVHLQEATEALETAAEQAGLNGAGANPQPNGDPRAPIYLVRSALAALPNPDEHWDQWIKIGMATYAATAGSVDGLDAWNTWSAKSSKYVAGSCDERWSHFRTSPPTKIGFGTLTFWAKAAGWQIPDPAEDTRDAPDGPPPGQKDAHQPAFLDPWADPPPPDFPHGVLQSAVEDAVFTTALRNGFCPGVLSMAELAAISGAASKSIRFTPYQDSIWWVPPIVWVLAILDVGQKKTAIQELAFAPLKKAHNELWAPFGVQLRQWRALSAKEKHSTPKPEEPHSFTVDDITVEALQRILSENDRGTCLISDEIAGRLDFGRYGGSGDGPRSYLCETYEANPKTIHRIGRDSLQIKVNGVTIYASIQPDRLKDFPDLVKDGLLQRFNMIRTAKTSVSCEEVTSTGTQIITKRINELIRIDAGRYKTTPEGSDLIHATEALGQKLSTITDFGVGFQGTCNKLHGTHARYALVLHLLDDPSQEVIPTATVERAGRLIRNYLLPQARDFFASLSGSVFRQVQDVAGWILVRASPRFLASDVTAGVRSCRGIGSKQLGEILDPLVVGGWIRPETNIPNNRAWIVDGQLKAAFPEQCKAQAQRREEVYKMLSQLRRPS